MNINYQKQIPIFETGVSKKYSNNFIHFPLHLLSIETKPIYGPRACMCTIFVLIKKQTDVFIFLRLLYLVCLTNIDISS